MAVALAYGLAFLLRSSLPLPLTAALLPHEVGWQPHAALALLLATQLPLLYVLGLYDVQLLRTRGAPLPRVAAAIAIQLLLVTAWYFFRGEIAFPRSVLLLYAGANAALVYGSRRIACASVVPRGNALRVALIGASADVAELHAQLAGPGALTRHGVAVVGVVAPSAAPPVAVDGRRAIAPRTLGTIRNLARLVRVHDLEQLIVVPGAGARDDLLEAVLRATAGLPALRVAVVPSVYELRVGRLASLRIDDVPLIEVARDPADAPSFRVKAVLDYLLATALLALALPVCAVAALAIRATSTGPVLFRQRRVGRGGREFLIYKLRTMHEDAEHATGPVLACDGDSRVTAVGRFLRATRIDEIPQLLNVLNGTMSLVGPRPERPEFAESLAREIPGYAERWLVRAGPVGPRAGARRVPHLARVQAQVRPRLHPQPHAAARPAHHGGDGQDAVRAPRRLSDGAPARARARCARRPGRRGGGLRALPAAARALRRDRADQGAALPRPGVLGPSGAVVRRPGRDAC